MNKENTVVLYTVQHSASASGLPLYEGLSLAEAKKVYDERIKYFKQLGHVIVGPARIPMLENTIQESSIDFYGSQGPHYLSIKKRLIGGP